MAIDLSLILRTAIVHFCHIQQKKSHMKVMLNSLKRLTESLCQLTYLSETDFSCNSGKYCFIKKCDVIYYGAHADDAAGNAYPDCSEVFYNAMNTAVYEGSGRQLKIEAPLVTWNKATVVKKDWNLKFLMSLRGAVTRAGISLA